MLLFGGVSVRRFDDLWAFDLRTQQWTELTQAKGPSPRDTGLFVLHPSGDQALYYGGRPGTHADAELWSLDLTTDTWTKLGKGPPGRFEFGYAQQGDQVWLYGGNLLHGIETDELWELELSSAAFRKLPVGHYLPPKATSPGLMALGDALFLTGGHDNAGRVGFGTWKYDLRTSAWEPVTTEGSLAAEAHFAYVVDPACSELLLHGGDNSDGQDRSELVAWSPSLSRLAVLPTEGEPPAPRRHHAAVWVPERRTLVLFGGWAGIMPTDTFFGDTWTLEVPGCAFPRRSY
jgi:hypothetical protein